MYRSQILSIDNKFFFNFMSVQGVFAFLLTAFAGPGLISPDLANGALPLYFCRPFSRAEYVLGKSSVLAILLSQITWIPGLILFAMQASLAGPSWTWNHLWIAGSLVLSSLIWIAILSLLAMALSAWVKWRIVAGALLLAVMFFGAGFAQAINAVMRTESGHFFNVAYLMTTVWNALFQVDTRACDSGRPGLDRSARVLCHLPRAADAQGARLRGGPVSDRHGERSHRLRGCVEVLRRNSGREPGESFDSAGNHEPGGPERFGQDHADESDDRPGEALARADSGARLQDGRSGKSVQDSGLLARNSTRFRKVSRDFSLSIPICGWRAGMPRAPSKWPGEPLSA